jgi:protoheme IX farnesyltransferase
MSTTPGEDRIAPYRLCGYILTARRVEARVNGAVSRSRVRQAALEGERMPIKHVVGGYILVTKPKSVLLLAFTSLSSALLAFRVRQIAFNPGLLALIMLTSLIAPAGCNALNCYIDRDIDAVMERTKRRPIPSGRIKPPEKALCFGLLLVAFSLTITALALNFSALLVALGGVFCNVIVYSIWLKRRNPVNIIVGGFSGGAPALFGWTAVTGSLDGVAILLAALVVLWIPSHIWSLAIYYSEDYRKARVPMLPVVTNVEKAIRCMVLTSALLFAFSIALYWIANLGLAYLTAALSFGSVVLAGNIYLAAHPKPRLAWRLYKLSSPYLFILFLSMVINAYFSTQP